MRDRALAVRRLAGHVGIDRQRAEQRDQHQHDRGQRRQQAGGLEGDRRLIAERAEVIDAGQAHDPQPEALVHAVARVGVGAGRRLSRRRILPSAGAGSGRARERVAGLAISSGRRLAGRRGRLRLFHGHPL